MRLQTRIQLSTTVVLIVFLIIANTSIYFIFKNSSITSEQNRLANQSREIMNELSKKSNVSIEDMLQAYLISDGVIKIVDRENNRNLQVETSNEYEEIESKYSDDQFAGVIQYKDSKFVIVSIPMMNENGAVVNFQIIENADALFGNIKKLKWVLVYTTIIVSIMIFVTSGFLGRVILIPIQRLTKTMNVIEKKGSFEQISITKDSKDELNELANTFNRMIAKLEDSYMKQEQFVSDASHELKTPLTVIDSYIKLLNRWGKERPEILQEAIDSIATESDRMKYLTGQLLQLAKSEDVIENEKEVVNIVSVIEKTIQRLQQAFEHDIHFLSENNIIEMKIHEQSFVQLLVILLDNAKKYSEKDIKVELKEINDRVDIHVIDKGIGIPIDAMEHVFDRLYRVDKTRSRKTGGSGLGLSIAKRIVEQHGGKIYLESVEGNGSTFIISLPKWKV